MSSQKKDKLLKITKEPAIKAMRGNLKKEIPVPIKEAFKEWKNSQEVTLSLLEIETILDEAFNAVDNIWIDHLTQIITKLDSISSELSKVVNEHKRGDLQTEYTKYDKYKDTIITKITPRPQAKAKKI